MRKLFVVTILVFALAFTFGFTSDTVQAKKPSSSCYYTCGCNGVPLYCCLTAFGVSCKVALWSPFQCPQIADC